MAGLLASGREAVKGNREPEKCGFGRNPGPPCADSPFAMKEACTEGDATTDTVEIRRAVRTGPWHLEIGAAEGTRCVVLDGRAPVVLGSGRSADVAIADRHVSGTHCSVEVVPDGIRVRDLGSRNGLHVGSARLESALLTRDGAAFVIGQTSVTLRGPGRVEAPAHAPAIPGLIGDSAPMRRLAEEITRHARSRAAVLLEGESGTGKDVVARALHVLSGRSGEYVPLNAGAFPDALSDSELFGHRRGAYTGAVANRRGAFELAHRGTLFLDEVAELAPSVQVKLLRVVEDGSVRPIGGTEAQRVDVRLVSASWVNLAERVRAGAFRTDLYHRLSTVTLSLPPLRARRGDIPLLARALLTRLADDVGAKELSSSALARLANYGFPGNVRELHAILYRAAMSAPGREIEAEHLSLPAEEAPRPRTGPAEARALLEHHRGNVSAAARAAGVPRSTFRAWIAGQRA
jgi:transcriptional regulator of acetoin/glycerol metabolism